MTQSAISELARDRESLARCAWHRSGCCLHCHPHYPTGVEPRLYGTVGYIRPVVRPVFGWRGDVWPTDEPESTPTLPRHSLRSLHRQRVRSECRVLFLKTPDSPLLCH